MAKKRRQEIKIQKKKRRRKRFLKRLLKVLFVLAVFTLAVSLIYAVFQVKKINVKGNQYTSSQEIIDWMKKDRFSDNTIYLYFKYNQDDVEQLPSVESVEVKLKSPWIVEVQVHEKEFVGGIDCGEKILYFDAEGIASLLTSDSIEGIPYIEGVDMKAEKVELGKTIPVEDTWIYEQLREISICLAELELEPERIVYDESGFLLYLDSICVQLGKDTFEERLQQIPPILEKLKEQYNGVTGTLHLENFDSGNTTIRFVPDKQPEEEASDEDTYEDLYGDGYGDIYADTYDYGYGNTYTDTYDYGYGDTYDYGYCDTYTDTYDYGYDDTYTDGYWDTY